MKTKTRNRIKIGIGAVLGFLYSYSLFLIYQSFGGGDDGLIIYLFIPYWPALATLFSVSSIIMGILMSIGVDMEGKELLILHSINILVWTIIGALIFTSKKAKIIISSFVGGTVGFILGASIFLFLRSINAGEYLLFPILSMTAIGLVVGWFLGRKKK